jgi:hypothetical protein
MDAAATPNQFDRSHDKIIRPFRHFAESATARVAGSGNPSAPQFQRSVGVLLKVQSII